MTINAQGVIVTVTAGTPVPLTSDTTQKANKIVFSQNPASTGKVYLKYTKGSAAGVIVREFLPPGTAGLIDQFCLCASGNAGDPYIPSDWSIDSAVSGEGAIVYWVTI